jgi:hypothetical protein
LHGFYSQANLIGMLEYRTLGQLADGRMSVTAYCEANACHHSGRLNLGALAERYGRDFDFFAVNLRPRMKCSKCDRRGATFIVSPHLTTAAELYEKENARITPEDRQLAENDPRHDGESCVRARPTVASRR